MILISAPAVCGQSADGLTLPRLTLEPERSLGDAPLAVRIVDPPANARIRFTTDGSEPTPLHGQDYQEPWRLTQTTILRVAAFVDGAPVTRPSTHSYLFLESALRQPSKPAGFPNGPGAWQGEPSIYGMNPQVIADPRYAPEMKAALRALPSLSVVCSPEDLFGTRRGLYLHSQYRGVDWEKACSLEWIETNGVGAFQIDCGLRIQGNTGRRADKTPKHSFRVLFKDAYGAGKLRHRVFPDSPVRKFDTLVLRADYNNAWTHWSSEDNVRGQRTRDAWLKDTHRDMGWVASHSRYVHLYLNGLYWGIYDVTERPDASFAAAYLGGEREDYDVFDDSGLKAGGRETARDRSEFARRGGPTTVAQAGERFDVVQFIDYLLLNYYVGNNDWGEHQNWYLIRRRQGSPDEQLFRYYVWDGEIILQSVRDDVVNRPRRSPIALGRRLAIDPEYRLAFADRVQKHCFGKGALTPAASAARWLRRADEVKLAILAESARWGHARRDPPFTRDDDWLAEQRRLLNGYFPQRTRVLLQQLRQADLYPPVKAPLLITTPVVAGQGATIRHVAEADPSIVVYYTTDGTDPRVAGVNKPAGGAMIFQQPVKSPGPIRIKARALQGDRWSALVEVDRQ